VHVKGFVGDDGQLRDSPYFNGGKDNATSSNGKGKGSGERKGVTWSIQVRGRFLKEISSDDVLFGNTFDRPLKLPWGSSAALKFMNFVDPTLEHALSSERPWALSPLIATMPYFAIARDASVEKSETDAKITDKGSVSNEYIEDDVSQLEGIPRLKGPASRRSYFASAAHRQQITYHPQDTISTDFCYGFLSFPEIKLNLPGGISFDLMHYWDGQPVRFVCCERIQSPGKDLKGPGDPFWVVVFEAVLDDFEEEGTAGTSHSESSSESNGSSQSDLQQTKTVNEAPE